MSQGYAKTFGVGKIDTKIVDGKGVLQEFTTYRKQDGTQGTKLVSFPFEIAKQLGEDLNTGLTKAKAEKPPRTAISFQYTGAYRQPSQEEREAGVRDVLVMTDVKPCEIHGNHTVIMGGCKAAAAMTFFKDGDGVAKFSVAVGKTSLNPAAAKDAPNEEKWLEHTDWYNVEAAGKWADAAMEKVTKAGLRVLVEGSLQRRDYEKDGEKRSVWELKNIRKLVVLPTGGGKRENGDGEDRSGYDYAAPAADFAYGQNVNVATPAAAAADDADWGNA